MMHGQPLHLGACARLRVAQHRAPHQLGDQRHPERFPKLKVRVDRERARVAAVHDAAARQRIHDAHRRCAGAQEAAERIHRASMYYTNQPMEKTGDMDAAGDHVPRDQGGDAASLFIGLSALGFRPAERRSTTCRSSTRRRSARSSAATRCACSAWSAEEKARRDGVAPAEPFPAMQAAESIHTPAPSRAPRMSRPGRAFVASRSDK